MAEEPTTPATNASAARVRANRENAKRSTGPKTAAGKERSSANAIVHGIYSHSRSITHGVLGEDQEQVEAFLNSVVDELAPRDTLEASCANKIATILLAERRRDRFENGLLQRAGVLTSEDQYALGGDPDHLAAVLQTLSRAADWGCYHFQQPPSPPEADPAQDDPFLEPAGLYEDMAMLVAGLAGEEVQAAAILETDAPVTPAGWRDALISIVEEAFPTAEGYSDCLQLSRLRAQAHRRLILDRAEPLAAARSLAVLERTLATSERIGRELVSALKLYDLLRSRNLQVPDPDQDQDQDQLTEST